MSGLDSTTDLAKENQEAGEHQAIPVVSSGCGGRTQDLAR